MAVPLHVNALITVTGLSQRVDPRTGQNYRVEFRNLFLRQSGRRLVDALRVEDAANPIYDVARTAFPDADLTSFTVIPAQNPEIGEAEYTAEGADFRFTYKIPITIVVTYSQIIDKRGLIAAIDTQRINDFLNQRTEFTTGEAGIAANFYTGITNKTFTVSEGQAGGRKRKLRKSRKGRKVRKTHKRRSTHRRG